MTMYRKKDALSGRETIYLEIPDDQLSKWLLLQATASTGTSGYVELGEPIGDLAFQFQKLPDDRIAIMVPNWTHIAPGDALTEKNVRAVYPDAIIQAYRVEAKQPAGLEKTTPHRVRHRRGVVAGHARHADNGLRRA